MIESRKHISFFSQTGSEIADIAEEIGIWPDLIVTNKRPIDLRTVDKRLEGRYIELPNVPTEEDYLEVLENFVDPVITLHGWLRIMPENICKEYLIFNGHPGLITEYEELKGKDPQKKAYDLKLEYSGSVIHRVTSEVDGGEILRAKKVLIKGLELDEVFHILKQVSKEIWIDFIKKNIRTWVKK